MALGSQKWKGHWADLVIAPIMMRRTAAVLRDSALSTEQKRVRLEDLALKHFDFAAMSRLVLARNWKRFSKPQQLEFVEEFKDFLSHSYADRIDRYSEEEIEVLINTLGNTALPPEMRVLAVTLLAAFDPAETVRPLVAMLAANEPLVLVAVIENLPQAAEDLALPELKQLGSSHPNPEVRAAARARLTEFEEFHQ